jgi:transposase
MEIITGVERRRRWRVEDKLRIVAEAEAPGACFAHVARRYEVSRGLLWNWRQQVRRGALGIDATPPMFMPMQMLADTSTAATSPSSGGKAVAAAKSVEGSRIEIALPDGTCIRVGTDVGLVALRRVIAAVRR